MIRFGFRVVMVFRFGCVCVLMDCYGFRCVCILGRMCFVLLLLVILIGLMFMVVSVLVNESFSIIICCGVFLSVNVLCLF